MVNEHGALSIVAAGQSKQQSRVAGRLKDHLGDYFGVAHRSTPGHCPQWSVSLVATVGYCWTAVVCPCANHSEAYLRAPAAALQCCLLCTCTQHTQMRKQGTAGMPHIS